MLVLLYEGNHFRLIHLKSTWIHLEISTWPTNDLTKHHEKFDRETAVKFLTWYQWCCQLCVDKLCGAKSCEYGTCHTDSQPPAGKHEININAGSGYGTLWVDKYLGQGKGMVTDRQEGYAQETPH